MAVALIVLFEWIDDRLRTSEEAQEIMKMEVVASIPTLTRSQKREKPEDIASLSEACHILCANHNAAKTAKPFKLFMVTSAMPGEGKSAVAANLASFLAMSNKRVLLVDANLRLPTLDRYFHVEQGKGVTPLTYAMLEMGGPHKAVPEGQETDIPTLRLLTAGTPFTNPSDLFQSPLAEQFFSNLSKAPFDYVILDAPPFLPIADAQILANYVQGILLVVDATKTPRRVMRQTQHLLHKSGVRLLGMVINRSPWLGYGDNGRYAMKAHTRVASNGMYPALGGQENENDKFMPVPTAIEAYDHIDQAITLKHIAVTIPRRPTQKEQ